MHRSVTTIIFVITLLGCFPHRPLPSSKITRITVAAYTWRGTQFFDPNSSQSFFHHDRSRSELIFYHVTCIGSDGVGAVAAFPRLAVSPILSRCVITDSLDSVLHQIATSISDTVYYPKSPLMDGRDGCMLVEREDGSSTLISYADPDLLPPTLRFAQIFLSSLKGDSNHVDISFFRLSHLATLIALRDERQLLTPRGQPLPSDPDDSLSHD
jgi:hypothetical protein